MEKKIQLVKKIEDSVGTFSKYQCRGVSFSGDEQHLIDGQDILPSLKPAMQLLDQLQCDHNELLTMKSDLSEFGSRGDIGIKSFARTNDRLTITKERVKELYDSAKVYINSAIITPRLYKENLGQKNHDSQNLAIGIVHAQKIDLLVQHQMLEDGKAIAAPRSGSIERGNSAMILLSAPALNVAYGMARSLVDADKIKLLEGMYRNLFSAAIDQGCEYISMPAAGLGVFGGDPNMYFSCLNDIALEYPNLCIIYHPAMYGSHFDALIQSPNIYKATKDVMYIASELCDDGHSCAFHNPSDAEVVFGTADVGMYWKKGKGQSYVGEEHIGSVSTAPLNSFGLNSKCFKHIEVRDLSKSVDHNLKNPKMKKIRSTLCCCLFPTSKKNKKNKIITTDHKSKLLGA